MHISKEVSNSYQKIKKYMSNINSEYILGSDVRIVKTVNDDFSNNGVKSQIPCIRIAMDYKYDQDITSDTTTAELNDEIANSEMFNSIKNDVVDIVSNEVNDKFIVVNDVTQHHLYGYAKYKMSSPGIIIIMTDREDVESKISLDNALDFMYVDFNNERVRFPVDIKYRLEFARKHISPSEIIYWAKRIMTLIPEHKAVLIRDFRLRHSHKTLVKFQESTGEAGVRFKISEMFVSNNALYDIIEAVQTYLDGTEEDYTIKDLMITLSDRYLAFNCDFTIDDVNADDYSTSITPTHKVLKNIYKILTNKSMRKKIHYMKSI